jgi:hypothetical protein
MGTNERLAAGAATADALLLGALLADATAGGAASLTSLSLGGAAARTGASRLHETPAIVSEKRRMTVSDLMLARG